ncbi:NtaA/DmoA family FMN-dependent monooxygenase OS=Streptomyces microflavus OX=1919 GN=G3I39_03235 PE=3 SV=1 [Streptomyces microflavus]
MVTSYDAFTGENFPRGGLTEADRYTRAAEFVTTARELWDSWGQGDLKADAATGEFTAAGAGRFAHRGQHFDISGRFTTPSGPQGHPVIIQSGESDAGREFAASDAEVIFSKHNRIDVARDYRDVKRRLAAYGREPRGPADPPHRQRGRRRHRRGGRRVRGGDRPRAGQPADRDRPPGGGLGPRPVRIRPDGRCDMTEDEAHFLKGHSVFRKGRAETARQWRKLAEERNFSIRELVIEVGGRQTFVGARRRSPTPSTTTCRPRAPTASSSCPTSPRAAWTTSWTGWCRSSRRRASTATATPAPRSGTTWACPPHPAGRLGRTGQPLGDRHDKKETSA